MTMQEPIATHETTARSRANGGSAAPAAEGQPADVVTLALDPHVSYEAYAEVREKGPVVRVTFSMGDKNGGGDEQASDFREFMKRDHLFVTRYEHVIAALLDN